ncbi:MAG: signal recognition particle subunit SRP19/SEC65 family protein [Candidatus Hydrothermarchaeales archaeon]
MKEKTVVWPINLDSHRTRKTGRKIPLKEAVEEPSLKEMETAAEKLGLTPVAEAGRAHPSEWWAKKGRLLLEKDKKKSKSARMKEIARSIKKNRNKKAGEK